jgi:hypothetical protein
VNFNSGISYQYNYKGNSYYKGYYDDPKEPAKGLKRVIRRKKERLTIED